jgi:glycine cleavage system H protein
MSNPSHLKYTTQHEWLDSEGDVARVGVTAYASEALGDIVYIDLPEVGTTIERGEACGELESTKSVSELFAPANGEVLEVNHAVVADPSLLNTDPYGAGWLFLLRVADSVDLLDASEYDALIGE